MTGSGEHTHEGGGTPGATGEQGEQGVSGAGGATGERGRHGATGEQGASGAGGATGEQGATGETGARGRPGRALSRRQILMLFAFVALVFLALIVIVSGLAVEVADLSDRVDVLEAS